MNDLFAQTANPEDRIVAASESENSPNMPTELLDEKTAAELEDFLRGFYEAVTKQASLPR